MFRASHLPPIATPALRALKLSLIPTLHLSTSSSTLYRLSSLVPSQILLPKTLITNLPHLPSFNLKRARPMLSNMCPQSTASFSSGRGDREILVQHLLVKEDNLKLLLDIQKRISEGEDLSDLAVEYSICPSKEEGGMLGWVRKGQMVSEFEEAAFNAPVNKVVRCKTKFGWHLVQVLSEREESIFQDIQPNELHVKMQDTHFFEEAQLIDVREPEEVAQASLPGFQILPLRQFGSWGPEITAKFDLQKDTYVLCHHGMRSLQVAKWLQTQDFKTKAVIDMGHERNDLCYLDYGNSDSALSATVSPLQWHFRLGHLSLQKLRHVVPHLSSGFGVEFVVCQFGKHHRSSFSHSLGNY